MLDKIRDFVITKIAGKLLMITGLVGMMITVVYDRIVTRAVDAYVLGYMQKLALTYCIILMIVGFILDDYMSDL